MIYNRPLTVYTTNTRRANVYQSAPQDIGQFFERLRSSQAIPLDHDAYMALPKGQQDDLKDVGGYVLGELRGGRRKAGAVLSRCAAVLDADNLGPGETESAVRRVETLGCCYCIYSTAKHSTGAPRLRIVIPFSEDIPADEYEPVTRLLCQMIQPEMTWFDPTTAEPSRMMYYPAHCQDIDPVYYVGDKLLLNARALLSQLQDWRDVTSWPRFPLEQTPARLAAKQGDPEAKHGVVGAFCRVYDVPAAMDKFLPGVYEETDTPGRYTFTGGTTTGGAVLYDGGKFLYSYHATDPCSCKLVNAFDLVRLHRFGDKDDEAKPGTLPHQLPSYKAMEALCRDDSHVKSLMDQERGEAILERFQALSTPDGGKELARYLGGLKGEILTTDIIRQLLSLLGIRLRLNEITWRVELEGYPKAWTLANAENLLPVKLLDHLRLAGVKGAAKGAICDSLDMIAEENRYNPVVDMLVSTTWDSVDRLRELYQIWGVDDPFYQTLARKWLIQCVAMGCNDEISPQGADGVLVPQGEQGLGKTSSLRVIVPLPRMFKEGAKLDLKEKDTYMQALNCWICELGELDRTTIKDSAGLKAFITQALDEYRTPYSRKSVQRPRRTSFCGTVNPGDFLVDETGNRRFWTIPMHRIDLQRLFSLTDDWKRQLWGQIYAMYLQAPQGFRLTGEERAELEARNLRHTKELDFEQELMELLELDLPEKEWGEFTAAEVAARIFARPSAKRLSRVLVKLERENLGVTSRILAGRRLYRLPLRKAQNVAALRVL